MKTINLTPRFWFAAVLVLITLFIGLIGPFIVRTDPDAVIGGLCRCCWAPTTRARA
jgi:peptide/nickel transport system permease protein